MRCREATQAILEADREELEGRGTSPLAEHVRRCSQCRSMIDTLLKDQEELAQELTTSVQLPDLDRILNRALDSDPAPRRFPRGLRRRAVAITLLPLAAAAALGALLLTSDPSLPGPPYTPPAPEQGLGLEVSSDANVAVLATNDPSITVLWLY